MKHLMLFVCFVLCGHSLFAQKDSSLIILQHVNVIDGISNSPLIDVTVTIKNAKITSIKRGSAKTLPTAIVLDLKGKWVLPGYIDAHVHFYHIDSARNALATGVTTARTMGANKFFDIQLRQAHNTGDNHIPDVVAAGYGIRPDMPEEFYSAFPALSDMKPEVKGGENVRRLVRALVSAKVNLIKVFATERAGTPGTDPRKRTFTNEELMAIVDEAKKEGIRVAAHAHGDEGAYAAVQAGVFSIEHGTYLSDSTLSMMKQMGTYLVPTFSYWKQVGASLQNRENPVLAERIRTFEQLITEVTKRAYKMGIPIAAGTDTRYSIAGLTIATEAMQLQKAGLSAMDVIKSMTSVSAKCLGIDKSTGSLKKGLDADILILEKNPLEGLDALRSIKMVINDGRIVINNSSAVAVNRTTTSTGSNFEKEKRTSRSKSLNTLDSIDRANQEMVRSSGNDVTKAHVSLQDSLIDLSANIRKDHRIFGYAHPDVKSERIFLLSVFTNDVENNPFNCRLGAYYDTRGMKDLTLKYMASVGEFVRAIAIDKSNKSTVLYFERKWIEFD
ncbi:MAG: amidohydrolase family protein [Chitinophagaceae bacterium]|nr:amidohydrolase family protein [Chitinophagaceae bacterium]